MMVVEEFDKWTRQRRGYYSISDSVHSAALFERLDDEHS
jgi:hypothetical protein